MKAPVPTLSLRQVLTTIRDEFGHLTPELVVEVARNPKHPLHTRFEWDDTIAADRWRMEQAGQLLRVVYRPDPLQPTELRAFVAIKGEDTPRSEYVPTDEALADPLTKAILLRSMDREWKAFKQRYQHMAEYAQLLNREAAVSA